MYLQIELNEAFSNMTTNYIIALIIDSLNKHVKLFNYFKNLLIFVVQICQILNTTGCL